MTESERWETRPTVDNIASASRLSLLETGNCEPPKRVAGESLVSLTS